MDDAPKHWFLELIKRQRYRAAMVKRWSDPAAAAKLMRHHDIPKVKRRRSQRKKLSREHRQAIAAAQRKRHAVRLDPLRGPSGLGLTFPPAHLRIHNTRYEMVFLDFPFLPHVADGLWDLANLPTGEKEHMVFEPLSLSLVVFHGWRAIRKRPGSPMDAVRLPGGTYEVGGGNYPLTLSTGETRTIPVMIATKEQ